MQSKESLVVCLTYNQYRVGYMNDERWVAIKVKVSVDVSRTISKDIGFLRIKKAQSRSK